MRPMLVVAGSLAQRRTYGGHAWALLQYVLGFRRLGWTVLFLDRLTPEMCEGGVGSSGSLRSAPETRRFVELMEAFGLEGAFSLDLGPGQEPVGLRREEVLRRIAESTLVLNVMGFLVDEEILARARRLVFLDIDPGFGQMWRELGLCDLFAGHDAFVTVGGNVGRPGCGVPTCGLSWITIRPPVVLDFWPPAELAGERFTTVASWRGPYAPVEYQGRTYGLRVHEFRKFASVPHRTGLPFQVALDIDPRETADIRRLVAGGWSIEDPVQVAGDPWAYRDYIRGSRAEFMVAKSMYVRTSSGWFSDRTACYLASGKPALVQDTGLDGAAASDGRIEAGEGLLLFRTLEEAAWGAREIAGNWERHSRAARALAVEHLDSDKVLDRLLERVAA